MAESSSKKDTMILRKDLSGAQEWIGAEASMSSLIVWRLSARNISGSCRFVMRRVFEGGVGWTRGGIVLKSIDIGLRDSLDSGRDTGGELSEDILGGVVLSYR